MHLASFTSPVSRNPITAHAWLYGTGAGAALLFVALALHAAWGAPWPVDAWGLVAAQGLRTAWLDACLVVLDALHRPFVAAVVGAFLLRDGLRRRWGAMGVVLAWVPGGMLVNTVVKQLVSRARPDGALVETLGLSFPSGHTVAATLACAYLLYRLFQRTGRRAWRVAGCVAAALLLAAVGFSRVYLGAHFPSDVAGAVLLGVAWSAAWLGVGLWAAGRGAQPGGGGAASSTMR